MAELVFFTGPMNCGKSTLALQVDFTQSSGGRKGRLFTSQDRSGASHISSRIGLERDAIEVTAELDFWTYVVDQLVHGSRIDYLVCDETQFYDPEHINQLARIVDELQIDVFAFGILSDFRTELFPGSRRLVELADHIETLQIQPLCWCGARGTHNARTVNGLMVTHGDQIVVGDIENEQDVVAYEVLCRSHHRRKLTRQVAQSTFADPLPFGELDPEEALDEFPMVVPAGEPQPLLEADLDLDEENDE